MKRIQKIFYYIIVNCLINFSDGKVHRIAQSVDWTQLGSDLDGEASGDESGRSVSLSSDGTVVAIGGEYNDGNGIDSGHVRVYRTDGSVWNQLGADLEGEAAGDLFGASVSLSSDGTVVAIGARLNDGNGLDSGHVRVYQFDDNDSWNKLGADLDGESSGDRSGFSVSLSDDGTVVAIGAGFNDGNGIDSGHAKVYRFNGSVWIQLGANIEGEAAGDISGASVSLSSDGTVVAIGARLNDDNGLDSGHARVYQFNGSAWNQVGIDIDGEAADDRSGFSVSLSGDGTVVAIGAGLNDGINGIESGHVRVYEYFPTPMPTPVPTLMPSSSPTMFFDGFSIASIHSSDTKLITITRTYGIHTNQTKTELLDASCTSNVTKLLYRNDNITNDDGKVVVISSIAVKPEEIKTSGDQDILFDSSGILTSFPSSIRGVIKFCLRSTSMLNTSPLLAVQSLSTVYIVGYNGTDREFSLSSDIGFSSDNGDGDGESIPVIEIENNVLSFQSNIKANSCSGTSTNQTTIESLSKGDIFYLCLKSDIGGVSYHNIDLFVLYDFDSNGVPSGQVTLISQDVIALPGLVQITQYDDATRISFSILPVFVQGSNDKLSIEGSAFSTFLQTATALKGAGAELSRSGFKLELTVVLDKEVGCFSKLLSKTMSLINSGL